jgi:hypothetical protein
MSIETRHNEAWLDGVENAIECSQNSESRQCEIMDQREQDLIHQNWRKEIMQQEGDENTTTELRHQRQDEEESSSYRPNGGKMHSNMIQESPPIWLPPAVTLSPKFVGSTRACEVAAQIHHEDNMEWKLEKSVHKLTEREERQALEEYVTRLCEIPPHHRSIYDKDRVSKWTKLQTLRWKRDQAAVKKREEQQLFKETIIAHKAAQKIFRAQQERLKAAAKELEETHRLVVRFEEALEFWGGI